MSIKTLLSTTVVSVLFMMPAYADPFAEMEQTLKREGMHKGPDAQPKVIREVQIIEREVIVEKPVIVEKRVVEPAPAPQRRAAIQPAEKQTVMPGGQVVNSRNYTFQLNGCEKLDKDITCNLTVVSNKTDKTLFLFSDTKLFDNSGNEYTPTTAQIANTHKTYSGAWNGHTVSKQLISGVQTEVKLEFRNVSTDARSITKFKISSATENGNDRFGVEFRDFALVLQ